MRIGVLALQGAVSEHVDILMRAGADEAIPVRSEDEIKSIDGLVIPGGESTTMGRLIKAFKLEDIIRKRVSEGMPVYGTCAGMILLSSRIEGFDQFKFGFIDLTIVRNAFGRQVDSKEIDLNITGLDMPFHAIFIRAPVAKDPGDNVQILSEVPEGIVFARQDNILVSAFHPELGDDTRVHEYFLDMVRKFLKNREVL
jgi:5'-phosphate synthase pdxT subunit